MKNYFKHTRTMACAIRAWQST